MYDVTFEGADGKQYSYGVDLLPTESEMEKIQKISAKHTEQGGDPNPAFIKRIISITPWQE
jgi:hypothetical protein